MKLYKFQDATGATVIVNAQNVLFIGQAADQAKRPLLGQSLVMFTGNVAITIKGSPDEIREAMMMFEN